MLRGGGVIKHIMSVIINNNALLYLKNNKFISIGGLLLWYNHTIYTIYTKYIFYIYTLNNNTSLVEKTSTIKRQAVSRLEEVVSDKWRL